MEAGELIKRTMFQISCVSRAALEEVSLISSEAPPQTPISPLQNAAGRTTPSQLPGMDLSTPEGATLHDYLRLPESCCLEGR